MSNTKTYSGINSILVQGKNWSEEMKMLLSRFPHEYLMYIQDDYFLREYVNNVEIGKVLKVIQDYKPAYFRLFPHRGPEKYQLLDGYEDIQFIPKGDPFITSLQIAIWHKESFLKLLQSHENIWEFEINSAERSENIDRDFLSMVWQKELPREQRHYPINYFCSAIRKGKWRKDAITFCEAQGISVDTQHRKVETIWDIIKKKYFYDKIPMQYQIILTKLISKMI
jgi:hypothetical protein